VFNSIQVTNYWFTLHRALGPLYQQAQTSSPNIRGISDQDVTHTDCLCKKFNAKNVKYIIVKKISSHFFCLNTLLSIHNVFHSVMLQLTVMNALSSQCMTDLQSFITNCK